MRRHLYRTDQPNQKDSLLWWKESWKNGTHAVYLPLRARNSAGSRSSALECESLQLLLIMIYKPGCDRDDVPRPQQAMLGFQTHQGRILKSSDRRNLLNIFLQPHDSLATAHFGWPHRPALPYSSMTRPGEVSFTSHTGIPSPRKPGGLSFTQTRVRIHHLFGYQAYGHVMIVHCVCRAYSHVTAVHGSLQPVPPCSRASHLPRVARASLIHDLHWSKGVYEGGENEWQIMREVIMNK